MTFISWTKSSVIEAKHDAITKLMEKCNSCDLLRNQEPDEVVTMSVTGYNDEESELSAMIAIAKYRLAKIMAVYAPEYLSESQMSIFEFFVRNVVGSTNKVIVFSKRDFEAIENYKSKPVNVQLYV